MFGQLAIMWGWGGLWLTQCVVFYVHGCVLSYGLLNALWFIQCAMAYSICYVLCGMYVMSYVHGLTQLWGYVVHMHRRHEHLNTACQVGRASRTLNEPPSSAVHSLHAWYNDG